MSYFTNAGPASGPILRWDYYHAIAVLGPGDAAPIGTAHPAAYTEGGVVIWEITVRGVALPGRWIVLGREFLPKT
jgi:hypothetical protein